MMAEDLIRKTWVVKLKKTATIEEIILVINSLRLGTKDEETIKMFQNYQGIEVKAIAALNPGN